MSACRLVTNLSCACCSRAMCFASHLAIESATDWEMRLCVRLLMMVGDGSKGVVVGCVCVTGVGKSLGSK